MIPFLRRPSSSTNAAHFIAYKGFREPLHGHNYQVSVAISGVVGADGYVLDFGVVKELTKAVCAELDERVLVPAESDCLEITRDATTVTLTYEDGTRFAFPTSDTVLLPIVHASAEELARYVLHRLRDGLAAHAVRGLSDIEVGVSEASYGYERQHRPGGRYSFSVEKNIGRLQVSVRSPIAIQ